jgi:hypothetical protein
MQEQDTHPPKLSDLYRALGRLEALPEQMDGLINMVNLRLQDLRNDLVSRADRTDRQVQRIESRLAGMRETIATLSQAWSPGGRPGHLPTGPVPTSPATEREGWIVWTLTSTSRAASLLSALPWAHIRSGLIWAGIVLAGLLPAEVRGYLLGVLAWLGSFGGGH